MKQLKADRRSQRTYNLVNAAFAELLSEKAYDEIVVQDILDRANIGRTTFYAHYFDKEDVLESMTTQILLLFTQQITFTATNQRVIPSLELFEHIYQSHNQHMRALMRGRAGQPLWEAMQTALGQVIEPALYKLCAERSSSPPEPVTTPGAVPVPVVSEYLAGAFITLLKWWLAADMPYPPAQMEAIFQQLTMPGVLAMLKE